MSIESWKAEFYPVQAQRCPQDQAIAHSLKKWDGLREENLQKHELRPSHKSTDIVAIRHELGAAENTFYIHSSSCALCAHFYAPDGVEEDEDGNELPLCSTCPLAIARAENGEPVACDRERLDEVRSPWAEWSREKNPEPMIFWLKKAAEQQQE